jgi:hypothetical protein
MLCTPLGMQYFTAHLKKEYSVENIEFLNAVSEYQVGSFAIILCHSITRLAFAYRTFTSRCPLPDLAFPLPFQEMEDATIPQLLAEARRILQVFIIDSAEKEVNIDSDCRKELIRAVANPRESFCDLDTASSLFDDAQREILILMARDSFKRFKQTEDYKTVMASAI